MEGEGGTLEGQLCSLTPSRGLDVWDDMGPHLASLKSSHHGQAPTEKLPPCRLLARACPPRPPLVFWCCSGSCSKLSARHAIWQTGQPASLPSPSIARAAPPPLPDNRREMSRSPVKQISIT